MQEEGNESEGKVRGEENTRAYTEKPLLLDMFLAFVFLLVCFLCYALCVIVL
jgi:hypothetical protein